MAQYRKMTNRAKELEIFRKYLEENNVTRTLKSILIELYMSEPRHENPLDFFRNALGDSVEKQSQSAFMENKIKVLETQNDLLKIQNAKLAALQDILEKFGEKMMVDEEYLEPKTQIVDDIEMCATDGDSNDDVFPIEEMNTESCDFSNAQNSTLIVNSDTDMSEFEDSLFNTKVEIGIVAQNTSESECEIIHTDKCNSPEQPEAIAVVSAQFDTAPIKSESAATPGEPITSDDRENLANEIAPNPDLPEATSVESTTSFERMITDIESGTIPIIEQRSPPVSSSGTFTFETDSETSVETVATIAEEPASDVYQLPTIVEEADVAPNVEDIPHIEKNTEESNEEAASDVYQLPTILQANLTLQIADAASQTAPNLTETDSASSDYHQSPTSSENEADCAAATPVKRSDDPEMVTNEINPTLDMAEATIVELTTSSEPVITDLDSGTIPIIEHHSSPEAASETFTFETDSEISTETIAPIADTAVSDVYELPTIPEEPDVTATPTVEDLSQIEQITTESIEESVSDVCQLPESNLTIRTTDDAPQTAPNTPEPDSAITDVQQSPTTSESIASTDESTVESDCPIPNDESSAIVCSEMAQSNAGLIDDIAKPIISKTESDSIATQLYSSTQTAPEIVTNENDSVIPCEISVTASCSSDTLSVDTDIASIPGSQQSIPASQQSLTVDFSESVINEIRTQILDDVLKEFNDSDETDSAVPFVDECPVKESNTLDDIEHYIRNEQDEQAKAECPVAALSIEADKLQPALETRAPISSQFNESQIVSLKYTESGTEILTLDVPVSHVSPAALFELETSLSLSQFSSDVGEEGDYLLPTNQSGVSSKINESASTISFGSSILETTGEYSTDRVLDSSSSSYATAILSENYVNDESTPLRATSPPTNEDISGELASEKNGKRKLSIADDYETEFLLSKSRKPEVQSTPFSST